MTDRRTLDLKDPSLLADRAFVAGQWIAAPDGRRFPVTDPFDGALIAEVPDLGPDTVAKAIDAADAAFPAWARRPAKERAQILRRWFDLIIANADDLALILTTEQGKPLAEARGEVVSNAAYLEWFAEEAKRIDGDIIPGPNSGQRILVLKQPIGVCAAITPWNFPNGMITRKAGPALAAGCPMILKPASQTPLSALALAVLAERAGVPAGVFSVVTGEARPIGEEFCRNPRIAKITFTGSTGVGRWLMREASASIKRLSLELGGNAPFVVFDDADLDLAVEGAAAGVEAWLTAAEAREAAEDAEHGADRRGDETPAWMADKLRRLERIRQAKADLEAEATKKPEDLDPDGPGPSSGMQKSGRLKRGEDGGPPDGPEPQLHRPRQPHPALQGRLRRRLQRPDRRRRRVAGDRRSEARDQPGRLRRPRAAGRPGPDPARAQA